MVRLLVAVAFVGAALNMAFADSSRELVFNGKQLISADHCNVITQDYLANRSLPFKDAVLSLSPKGQQLFRIANKDVSSYLFQVAIDKSKNKYVFYECPDKKKTVKFMAFDVYIPGQQAAEYRIGVRAQDLNLLQSEQSENPLNGPDTNNGGFQYAIWGTSLKFSDPSKSEDNENEQTEEHEKEKQESDEDERENNYDEDPDGSEFDQDSLLHKVALRGGALDYVICSDEGSVNVRSDDLKRTIFKAKRHADVKLAQGFGKGSRKSARINGRSYSFVKVQVPSQKGRNIGWVAAEYVKLMRQCSSYRAPRAESSKRSEPKRGNQSGALNFPVADKPFVSYFKGMRKFGAGRKGGRLHGACDIYRYDGDGAEAITSGKIILGPYEFYEGTWAVEVLHDNGRIVRYGEIKGRRAPGIRKDARVSKGQVVGLIGTVRGCRGRKRGTDTQCGPMLHYEQYKNNIICGKRGQEPCSLTQKWKRGYQRRSDLMNPTSDLQNMEKVKFGSITY